MQRLVSDKQHSNDLVIEDSTEGETVLGHGKAGVLQMEEEDQLPTNPRTTQARPRSSAKHRGLGISGPITSTEVCKLSISPLFPFFSTFLASSVIVNVLVSFCPKIFLHQ